MKNLSILVLLISILSCTENDIDSKNQSDTIDTKKELTDVIANSESNLTIEGMTCEIGCVRTVKSHLSKMHGVTKWEIDFDTERKEDFASIQYDSTLVSKTDIIKEIQSIAQGIYSVTKIGHLELNPSLTQD